LREEPYTMLAGSTRRLLRSAVHYNKKIGARHFSAPVKATEEEDGAVSLVTEQRTKMSDFNRHMVWGKTDEEALPAPLLPEDVKEVAALDPVSKQAVSTRMDGVQRTVVIRQQRKSARQAPLNPESSWRIFFYEDGGYADKWSNSLMGWTSNADPYQSGPPLVFENAPDAVYFAKKRGWNFVVKHPITRFARHDDAQYQDNFLPQAVASQVKREGSSCDHWHRVSAGTSHYFRPLKYHGDGVVRQHGLDREAEIAKAPEGYCQMR